MRGEKTVTTVRLGTPNARQREFFLADKRFVAYGGARGGGKSWAVQRKAILMAAYYGGIQILIVRRTLPELRENHILPMMALLNGAARYREADRTFMFENGSRIRFGYCDAQTDVLQYQGQSIDVIFIDEATQLTQFQFNALKACLRGANDRPKRMYLTCNPGGVGHAWVKRLFVDRQFEADEDAREHVFIPARVYDNEALMQRDPGYVKLLASLPQAQRRAWLEGDWNVFEGQYFTEFRPDIHVCRPFEVPRDARIYRTIDYGLDMLACYWIAVDRRERAIVFRELYRPGMTIYEAARAILNASAEKADATLAPPDLWNRRQESGKSVADWFARYGIALTKTSNARVSGWMAVHEWLRVFADEDGQTTARMRIFETCPNLIRTLPQLRHDDVQVNDVAGTPHELTHGPDALRGFCVHWLARGGGNGAAAGRENYADFLSYGV